jgi:hypothetical protein
MKDLDSVAQLLFDKIRGRFERIDLNDENGKATTDPEKGRFFSFVYTSKSIDDALKIFFNKKISKFMVDEDKAEWYSFLKDLRTFSRRNLLNFETHDISRDGLRISDIRQASHSDRAYTRNDVVEGKDIQEVKHFRTAYGWAGGAKPSGGKYKHPDQIKADREAKEKAKEKAKPIKTPVTTVDESSPYDKKYGVRYRVFGGREGRLVLKEKFFATQAQLDRAIEKIKNLDNFYEIDSYLYPPNKDMAESRRDKRDYDNEDRYWSKDRNGGWINRYTGRWYSKKYGDEVTPSYMTPEYLIDFYEKRIAAIAASPYKRTREVAQCQRKIAKLKDKLNRWPYKPLENEEDPITESRMFGTSRSSYQNVGPAKIIVKHSNPVNADVRGSRTRNIESIFIQTCEGERFKLPFKRLSGARAMATHIINGGTVYDEFGQHITEMVNEMTALRSFVRNGKNKTFENAEAMGIVEAAVERYVSLYKTLHELCTGRGYKSHKDGFVPDKEYLGEVDVNALKEKFVQKNFDERLTPALEYAYRAYQNKNKTAENQYVVEFENWMDTVITPLDVNHVERLAKLMSSEIELGVDGDNATNAIQELVGDDTLFDKFFEVSQSDGPNVDARPMIRDWMANNAPELLSKLDELLSNSKDDGSNSKDDGSNSKLGARQPVPTEKAQ